MRDLAVPIGMLEDVRHLVDRQVEVEAQDDDRAVVDGQVAEQPFHHVAVRKGRGSVERERRLEVGNDVQLDEVAPPVLPGHAVAGPHRQSMEPRAPRIRVPQCTHVLPGGDERVLHRVLGAVRIAEDEGGHGIQAID